MLYFFMPYFPIIKTGFQQNIKKNSPFNWHFAHIYVIIEYLVSSKLQKYVFYSSYCKMFMKPRFKYNNQNV